MKSAIAAAIVMLALVTASKSDAQLPTSEPPRPAEWAVPVTLAGAPNLHRVTPTFYRSAQPLKAGFPALAQELGIKTIVSLRAFHSDKKLASGSGLKLISIPINTWDIDRPDIVKALAAIAIAEKHGAVLLHCQHGADRTGLVTALYRVIWQGWTREKAIDEMRNGQFGYHAVWGNIPRFLKRIDLDKLRRDVAAKVCALESGRDAAKVCGKA